MRHINLTNKISILFLLIIACIIYSCKSSKVRINEPNDVEEAFKFIEVFYSLVEEQKFEDAAKYFGKEIPYEDGVDLLMKIHKATGRHVKSETTHLETTVKLENQIYSKEYIIYVNVVYENETCSETFTITNDSDRSLLKIVEYHSTIQ